jgi:hypothetical protein
VLTLKNKADRYQGSKANTNFRKKAGLIEKAGISVMGQADNIKL